MYGGCPMTMMPQTFMSPAASIKAQMDQLKELEEFLKAKEKKPDPWWKTKMTLWDNWMLLTFGSLIFAAPVAIMLHTVLK